MKLRVVLFSVVIFMLLSLVACSSTHGSRVLSNQYGSFCSKRKQCKMVAALKKHHVDVYALGDDVSVVLSVNQLFTNHVTVLYSESRRVLNKITELLACYQKISVKIVVYYAAANQKDLAKMRAIAIQRYFSKQKVNARLLYTVEQRKRTSHFDAIEILTRRLP